jgi:hypothetical protein
MAMYDAMNLGTLKIFRTLHPLIEELRLYHRKDGLIVKINDDAISAARYAFMAIRYARPTSQPYDWSADGRRRRGEWNDRSIAGVVLDIDPFTGATIE